MARIVKGGVTYSKDASATVTTGKLSYSSDWNAYPVSFGGTPPVPTKISFGNCSIVQLAGDFRDKTGHDNGYDGIVATLPLEFAPDVPIRVKGHYGNSDKTWVLTVTPEGEIRFSNFGNMSLPQEARYMFSATWIRSKE